VSDDGLEDKEHELEAAHVWARDGEGPHAVLQPPANAPEQSQSSDKSPAAIADLHDLVVLAGTAQAAAAELLVGAGATAREGSPASAGAEKAESTKIDGASSTGTAATEKQATDVNDEGAGAEGCDAEAGDVEEGDVEEGDADDSSAEPVSDGAPSKNEVAVGYIIPLVLYFVLYIVNFLVGGYCLSSERMNALGEICFYWTPALCALCLMFGSKWVKATGAVLVLPLSFAAVYGGQYFHAYERFQSETSPYGQLVKASDANGWRICQYESSWITGNQPGSTRTREKDVAPYVMYVKKMQLGEPP
jgi:hypothetical protein